MVCFTQIMPFCYQKTLGSGILICRRKRRRRINLYTKRGNDLVNALLFIALFWWALFLFCFIRDRSRYRNCFLLFFALGSGYLAISYYAGEYQITVLLVTAWILSAVILIVPFFLICNGIVMFRREGHSLANLLSLALGITVGAGELATFIFLLGPGVAENSELLERHIAQISIASAVISISVIYFSVVFVIFMIYSLFLQIIPHKRDFDYVVIHGAGLLDGSRVSKLLADRIDKAIMIYHKDPSPPILIPSGGRGSDEEVSEAEAMKQYMIEKGIPADRILMEDQSTTTYENLLYSKALIDEREGRKYTALVTSNYHVYRALRYCRKVGLECTGIGSRVAFYYWPSALIREFIAVHAEKKHFLYLMAGWIICAAPVLLLMLG